MIRVEGAEVIAAAGKSATGAYLKPLLERSTTRALVIPAEAGTQPSKKTRSSRAKSRDAIADQPDLIVVK